MADLDRNVRQMRRRDMLIDVVYAIVVWRLFMLIPRPQRGSLDAASVAEFLFASKIDLPTIPCAIIARGPGKPPGCRSSRSRNCSKG